MKSTEFLGLNIPENSDVMDIEYLNANNRKLDSVLSRLGGIGIERVTVEGFEHLPTIDSQKIYLVINESENSFDLYFGSYKLSARGENSCYPMWVGSEQEYNAISAKDPDTLYFIT